MLLAILKMKGESGIGRWDFLGLWSDVARQPPITRTTRRITDKDPMAMACISLTQSKDC